MEKIKTLFTNTDDFVDKEVVVEGWVKTVRDSKMMVAFSKMYKLFLTTV